MFCLIVRRSCCAKAAGVATVAPEPDAVVEGEAPALEEPLVSLDQTIPAGGLQQRRHVTVTSMDVSQWIGKRSIHMKAFWSDFFSMAK